MTALVRVSLFVAQEEIAAYETLIAEHLAPLVIATDEIGESRNDRKKQTRLAFLFPYPAPIDCFRLLLTSAGKDPACKLEVETIEERNWVEDSLRRLPGVRKKRFFIHGSHIKPDPGGKINLRIDANLAFGTGHHPTTAGCLSLLESLFRSGRYRRFVHHILDYGTGTGILAMGAAKLWRRKVDALDIDNIAVITAKRNIDKNHLSSQIRLINRKKLKPDHYQLVMANIHANPLIALAPVFLKTGAKKALFLLSGLLCEQERQVRGAYEGRGCRFLCRYVEDGWVTIMLQSRSG